ncbi:MAG: M20/M25/M40 family metallo-hydrolase [Spirochaetota bacterium]
MTLSGRLAQTNLVELALLIQAIPAPTFAEADRAGFVRGRCEQAGVHAEVVTHDDGSTNTYARVPGADPSLPVLLVSAHTDTVFPAAVDLAVRHDPSAGRISGPGLGDNSVAVAALVALAAALRSSCEADETELPCDVWFVANAGEEGLGDLRGMLAAIEHVRAAAPGGIGAAIVLEGLLLGSVYHRSIGVRRYRLEVEAPGGHSWGSFGAPSAVHELVRLLGDVVDLAVPRSPRTTFNVGRVEGGTSVNTIAAAAWAEIDLRSETTEEVERLERRLLEIARSPRPAEVVVRAVRIGSRPAGALDEHHPLVIAATEALAAVGIAAELKSGSTDANALLAAGVPAVCVGVTTGGSAHRLDEYINLDPIEQGLQQLALLVPEAVRIAASGS